MAADMVAEEQEGISELSVMNECRVLSNNRESNLEMIPLGFILTMNRALTRSQSQIQQGAFPKGRIAWRASIQQRFYGVARVIFHDVNDIS